MATPYRQQNILSGLGDFDIDVPASESSVPLLAGCLIDVRVTDHGPHEHFFAKVYDACEANIPLTHPADAVELSGNNSTFTGKVNVGFLDPFDILEATKQIAVWGVVGAGSVPKHQNFRIDRGGAGSMSCTGSGSQPRCGFCGMGAVPVGLTLTHSNSITNGTCTSCNALNRAFLLQHSNDTCLNCSWFSESADICGAGSMGYWRLTKTSATRWQLDGCLSTGAGSSVIVRYERTVANNDCAIPSPGGIDLTIMQGSSTGQCANWPSTVNIAPAP